MSCPDKSTARDAPTEARQLLPCGICGELTEYRCADCLMETGQSTPVCPKTKCRDKHEEAEASIHSKPSIDQLERILNQDIDEAIHVLPNGEIRSSNQKRSKVLTFREDLGGEYSAAAQPAVPAASEPCKACKGTGVAGRAAIRPFIPCEICKGSGSAEPPEPPREKCPTCRDKPYYPNVSGQGRCPTCGKASTDSACQTCYGMQNLAGNVCPDCGGTGQRRVKPDEEIPTEIETNAILSEAGIDPATLLPKFRERVVAEIESLTRVLMAIDYQSGPVETEPLDHADGEREVEDMSESEIAEAAFDAGRLSMLNECIKAVCGDCFREMPVKHHPKSKIGLEFWSHYAPSNPRDGWKCLATELRKMRAGFAAASTGEPSEEWKRDNPAYVKQDIALELLERLENAGFGKDGHNNSLWDMTIDVIAECESLRLARTGATDLKPLTDLAEKMGSVRVYDIVSNRPKDNMNLIHGFAANLRATIAQLKPLTPRQVEILRLANLVRSERLGCDFEPYKKELVAAALGADESAVGVKA